MSLMGLCLTLTFVSSTLAGAGSATECLPVADTVVSTILGRVAPGVEGTLTPIEASAVRSKDYSKVYMVAVEIKIVGVNDSQTGIWATNEITEVGGTILAVDGIAKQFTDWTHGDESAAAITLATDGVSAAKQCVRAG